MDWRCQVRLQKWQRDLVKNSCLTHLSELCKGQIYWKPSWSLKVIWFVGKSWFAFIICVPLGQLTSQLRWIGWVKQKTKPCDSGTQLFPCALYVWGPSSGRVGSAWWGGWVSNGFVFVLLNLFYLKNSEVNERGLLAHSPRACDSWGWAGLKSGGRVPSKCLGHQPAASQDLQEQKAGIRSRS